MRWFPLTENFRLHGDGQATHGEECEDRLVKPLMLKEVSCEVNGEEIFLGARAGDVPEGDVSFTDDKLTLAEHDAVHTCRRRYTI